MPPNSYSTISYRGIIRERTECSPIELAEVGLSRVTVFDHFGSSDHLIRLVGTYPFGAEIGQRG